jgi:hypothetical protein
MEELKICTKCHHAKPLDQFNRIYKVYIVNNRGPPRQNIECKVCFNCRLINKKCRQRSSIDNN